MWGDALGGLMCSGLDICSGRDKINTYFMFMVMFMFMFMFMSIIHLMFMFMSCSFISFIHVMSFINFI